MYMENISESQEWFRNLVKQAFNVEEAEERLSEEELKEVKEFTEELEAKEENMRNFLREARKDLKEGIDGKLPDGVTLEWENDL